MSEMSVEVALIVVDEMKALGAKKIYFHDNAPEAALALGEEVRRLRAAVERVKALPHLNWNDEDYLVHVGVGGYFCASDVLAALEVQDGD